MIYFLIYIFFINYFLKKFFKTKLLLTFSKNKKNIIVINRAPYRYKLSRHQLFISRYYYSLNIYFNNYIFNSISLLELVKLSKFFTFFFLQCCFLKVRILIKNKNYLL